MRSSILFAAPFVAAAYAQSSEANTTVAEVSTDGTTLSSTISYSNGLTSYLTMTNSQGVITGMPAVETAQSALPPAITAQPSVATIPAGLPEGVTHLLINISRSLTSFEVSVGSSTTVVLDAPESATILTGTGSETGSAATSSATGSSDDDSEATSSSSSDDDDSSETSGSSTGSAGAAESTGDADSAAGRVTLASAGVLGFGALVAAFL